MEKFNYWSETQSRQPTDEGTSGPQPGDPLQIGRYRVVRPLGQGGFGRVFLARDDELDRHVAIKVPNRERIAGPADVEIYLAEARALAKLEYPNIVPVYDLGRTDDGLCYVVSKFVDGSDLAERLRQGQLSFRDSVELTAIVALALHHAHTRGLVHRDVKPANILIDTSNVPWVADFGLALKDEDYGKGARIAGTPAYMSPEQARGEGHRVDGRSDIFSLGVVLYELLTGRKPFRGESRTEMMDQIASAEPRPLRQINDTIPRELERICQKALAKRSSERYSTGRDMAEDLRHFLETETALGLPPAAPSTANLAPASTQDVTPPPPTSGRSDSDGRAVRIIPKGLRSFDRHDADFFIELLPGPRDREGLPDGLRFWKTRIESTDPDATFRVGLIYGPSGCGKSSLVKAGLLPRLGKHVLPIYTEATAEETETRLHKGLRKACPELPASGTLVDALAALRRGHILRSGEKVLLVLDQFEQWLFARRDEQNTELVAALRQCDGEHVQAIVMVRDDFWMAATRFMRDLEIRLVEGENSAAVDLFDLLHARRVLVAFGRAYGVLPEKSSDLSAEQRGFLQQSVAGLAQDGKVISVRLALFAEMVKGKPWTQATLKDIGGTQGVGLTFLEETFSAATAPPEHRLHQKAAQAVLKALLPRSGTDIKGQMRSEAELREASGYASRPRDFDDLIGILDPELRLITPTDPEGSAAEGQLAPKGQRYYQLTHDYLVHSLRDWLTRKQRETRRGRAELRLAERAAIWDSKPENRHLPSVTEWASIRALTSPVDWTDQQRRMMRRASKMHGLRALGLAVVVFALGAVGLYGWNRVVEANQAKAASNLVLQLLTASTAQVPGFIREIGNYRHWTDPELRRVLEVSSDPKARLHASLALLPVDPKQVENLEARLLNASPGELLVLRDALKLHGSRFTTKLWTVLERAQVGNVSLLPAAGALAIFDPEDARWSNVGAKVAQALVTINPAFLEKWLDALRPVRGKLTAPLAELIRDKTRPETEQMLASSIIADYADNDPRLLSELLVAGPQAYRALLPVVRRQVDKATPVLRAELDGKAPISSNVPSQAGKNKDDLVERQARAAVALVSLGETERVWPLLRHSEDPRLRSFIVNWLRPLGADSMAVAAEFNRRLLTSSARKPSDFLFDGEISIRRALILALGTFEAEDFPAVERKELTKKLQDVYRNDPDSGMHGATEWTLRRWREDWAFQDMYVVSPPLDDPGQRRWFVNGQGQTFAVIGGPVEVLIGSPEADTERTKESEPEYHVTIPRRFAIATKEVTIEQFQEFVNKNPQFKLKEEDQNILRRYSPYSAGPWIGISWYTTAAYCNWLSKQERLPEDQWCYRPNKDGHYAEGMTIPADVLERKGYRLPTEAEWEYACRAGTVTSRYYGVSVELLGKYAWYQANGKEHAWPSGSLLPNDLGLFDMLGNVYEWCLDGRDTDRPEVKGIHNDIRLTDESLSDKRPRMCRGGMYTDLSREVRSAHRAGDYPTFDGIFNGFRIARTCP